MSLLNVCGSNVVVKCHWMVDATQMIFRVKLLLWTHVAVIFYSPLFW